VPTPAVKDTGKLTMILGYVRAKTTKAATIIMMTSTAAFKVLDIAIPKTILHLPYRVNELQKLYNETNFATKPPKTHRSMLNIFGS